MNGSGKHTFVCLNNRAVRGANHMKMLPFPPAVIAYINLN